MLTSLPFDPVPRRAPTVDEPLTVNLRQPPPDVYVPLHSHDWAQLAYPLRGAIRVSAAGMSWLTPAFRAVWIPPGIEHEVLMLGQVELRTVYVAREVAPLPLAACTVIEVSELMRSLIEALSQVGRKTPDDIQRRDQMIRLLLTEMHVAPTLSLGLPLPKDRRLQALCNTLMEDPASSLTQSEWAVRVGASERTLARLFRDELQMSFGAWRQQLRLAGALDMIGRGRPLGEVAAELGYSSQAAFSAMFKRAFGVQPGRFMQRRQGGGDQSSSSSRSSDAELMQ
ncbi:MAG: helix-turn-helix transcriptional regulator [Betaproteobacteria bacterium]|nr:helix-turn-helix transcriptional regulator [Betaproteobacteria bacterium]